MGDVCHGLLRQQTDSLGLHLEHRPPGSLHHADVVARDFPPGHIFRRGRFVEVLVVELGVGEEDGRAGVERARLSEDTAGCEPAPNGGTKQPCHRWGALLGLTLLRCYFWGPLANPGRFFLERLLTFLTARLPSVFSRAGLLGTVEATRGWEPRPHFPERARPLFDLPATTRLERA